MTWDEYEDAVLEYFQTKYHEYDVRKDVKLLGSKSNARRQIDVLIDGYIADNHIRIAVECKRWKQKLDVADVGTFIDKLNDVKISCGIMVARNGFTKSAYERAQSENNLQLHILDFESLPQEHGFFANPYRGDAGVILSAPTGWIVDSVTTEIERQYALCFLYPTNLSKQEALKKPVCMYLNLYPVKTDTEVLIKEQNEAILKSDPKAEIQMWNEEVFRRPWVFREIWHANKNVAEFTVFLSSDRFFCYVVSASSQQDGEQNLTRLKYVIKNAIFVVLEGVDPSNSDEHWKALFHRTKVPDGGLIATMM